MACDIPGTPSCNDHSSSTTINLFVPILLVCVLFALGTGVICRRFGFLGRRAVGGGLAFELDDSFQLDNGPNFGETPKIYDFSMNRDFAGEGFAHWATTLPVSARHIEDNNGTQPQETMSAAARSSPRLPMALRLRRFWKPESSNPSLEEQTKLEQPSETSVSQVSTSFLIAMPSCSQVSPNVESDGLPDIVLGIAEVPIGLSPSQPLAKVV